ncbi:bacteriocin immunity protein (plasmid) [Enterococcus faecalis]|nr:bacteriocin immunity protein [Enterococcus faecalis]
MTKSKLTNEKATIHELYNCLRARKEQSNELLDIEDVLLQVYKNIDSVKNSETLMNRLVQYIRSLSLKGRLHYSTKEENLIIQLGEFGKKAGLNGLYGGDFSDKSQFYKLTESIPRYH